MNKLFSSIYELVPFYSADLGDHLRGFDITCSAYVGTPIYNYVGITMTLSVIIAYVAHYHLIDSPRYNSKASCWITALSILSLNFGLSFLITLKSLRPGNFCKDLHISSGDIFGFAFENALVAFLLFTLITSIPYIRAFSTNCKHTTLLHP